MKTEGLFALGVFGSRSRLGKRVAMLLGRGSEFSKRVSAVRLMFSGVGLLALATMASLAPLVVSFAQQPADSAFEVASVKENKSGDSGAGTYPPKGQTYSVRNVPLSMLIAVAYSARDYEIRGMPQWAKDTRYDITAKAGRKITFGSAQPYVRRLLADRFKLQVHHETREGPIFKLVVAKGGPRLPLTADPKGGGDRYSRQMIDIHAANTARLASILSDYLGEPVLDNTGLGQAQAYDIKLQWSAEAAPGQDGNEPPPEPGAPSIFTAIQEQLGLKLEATKGPVERLVIDHVEKADPD